VEHEFIRNSALDSLDAEYRFGIPKLYLAPHELARLTILRSRLGDTPAERIARAAAVSRRRSNKR
jgi:hypothetical protein